MASAPIRIELRDLAAEREEAQRDLQDTLGAIEEKLRPQGAARRLLSDRNAPLVLLSVAAVGTALGLAGSSTGRTASVLAALAAGLLVGELMNEG